MEVRHPAFSSDGLLPLSRRWAGPPQDCSERSAVVDGSGHHPAPWAFLAIESLVGSQARRNLRISRKFGDDALGYFTERLGPAPTRAALAAVLHRAKRNKVFQDCRFVGLALDGTTGGRRRKKGCSLCRPYRNARQEILGHRHHLVLAALVGGDLTLPADVEAYAGRQRMLARIRRDPPAPTFNANGLIECAQSTVPNLDCSRKRASD
jgi:hypothetical protein